MIFNNSEDETKAYLVRWQRGFPPGRKLSQTLVEKNFKKGIGEDLHNFSPMPGFSLQSPEASYLFSACPRFSIPKAII